MPFKCLVKASNSILKMASAMKMAFKFATKTPVQPGREGECKCGGRCKGLKVKATIGPADSLTDSWEGGKGRDGEIISVSAQTTSSRLAGNFTLHCQ